MKLHVFKIRLLSSYGVNYAESSDCHGDCSDSDVEDPAEICTLGIAALPPPNADPPPSLEHIVTLMKQSNYNWFEFHQKVVAEMDTGEDISQLFANQI